MSSNIRNFTPFILSSFTCSNDNESSVAETCTIDFSTQEGEKVFFEWIDFLTDAIFDKLEAYERNRKAAQEMLSDGISEFKICKYMGINKNDLKMLLSNSHRNSRELSKES